MLRIQKIVQCSSFLHLKKNPPAINCQLRLPSHNKPEAQLSPEILEKSSVHFSSNSWWNPAGNWKKWNSSNHSSRSTAASFVIPLEFHSNSYSFPQSSQYLSSVAIFTESSGDTNPSNPVNLEAFQIRISHTTSIFDENIIKTALKRHGVTLQNLKLCGGKDFVHPRND